MLYRECCIRFFAWREQRALEILHTTVVAKVALSFEIGTKDAVFYYKIVTCHFSSVPALVSYHVQYLDHIKHTVIENVKCLTGAPSVQMQEVLPDILCLEAMEDQEEPDGRYEDDSR